MSSTSSGSFGSSSTRKSNLSYTACDFSLVMFQRLLICISVFLGFDLVYSPRDIPRMILIHAMARIIRNFFYLTKGVRKWLAIHYNEGIIPDPPMQYGRSSFHVARSTPNVSNLPSKFGESLKHSPIERRYSEPANKFDLATALKEQRNRSEGMEPIHRYADFSNSTDPFGHQSPLSFLFSGLAQSFLGYLDDPDEEMNKVVEEKAAASSNKNKNTAGTGNSNVLAAQSFQSSGQLDLSSENRRRVAEIVESVLEHDAQQRKMNSSSESGGSSYELKPLPPIPIFDESAVTPAHQQPKRLPPCITVVKGGKCSYMEEE